MSHEQPLPTPTRTLVETSVGVREAAKNLQRLSIHWESPQQIVLITKPDKSVMEKAKELLNYLLQYRLIIYIEDQVLPLLDIKSRVQGKGEVRPWNAEAVRTNALSASVAPTPTESQEKLNGNGGKVVLPTVTRSISIQANSPRNPLPPHIDSVTSHQHSLSKFVPIEQPTGSKEEAHEFNPEEIDLVITLGGDGTVLFASWLFQTIMPPLLPLHLGTLGFLTVFDFGRYQEILDKILKRVKPAPDPLKNVREQGRRSGSVSRRRGSSVLLSNIASSALGEQGIRITLRMRFTCAVYRSKTIISCKANDSLLQVPGQKDDVCVPDSQIIPEPDHVFQILNDLVVDRGPSPYMSSLEVFGDGKHLTTVQADGLVVSTPTGSTAYSLSAGGSLVHPEVPAILLMPICPHTLSFRPMLLPDSMELKIVVPSDARNMAYVAFDGRHRIPLQQGDAVVITASPYPVPTLCLHDQTKDWFDSLARCLRWNERVGRQKSFVWGRGVVEKDEEDEHRHDYPWDT